MLIGQRLRLPAGRQRALAQGALLHDVGKIGVPDAVLDKPGPLTLEEREVIEEHPARVMLWEAAPLPGTAERLAALGIESRVYAPAANRPAAGDWLDVMRANRGALRAPQAPAD